MSPVEQALKDVYGALDKLHMVLKPYASSVSEVLGKNLDELGASDKIKLAKLLLAHEQCFKSWQIVPVPVTRESP